ncbi:MAG: tyrosine--tRNA ligase [Patescibacteria group bacterium]
MKISTDRKKIKELLTRAVDEVIVSDHLEKDLLSGARLRVKFGIDPTAPDIHLGHTVPLRKLQAFQELGHQAVLIIGDFTATIGDPAGRTEARKQLSEGEVEANMKHYLDQAKKVLDLDRVEIHYNSEWFKKADLMTMYELMSKVSVQRALERDDFQKRMKENREIAVLEVVYPLLQGYDSVMVNASVEIGGRDQKFNLLMGRRVQRAYGMTEQDIMTLWLIEGTDGTRKMSKSFGNYIALTEEPASMYGKIMSIPDDLIAKYFSALTTVPSDEIDRMSRLSHAKSSGWNPREAKARLAREIATMYHSAREALEAEAEFERIFRKKEAPTDMPEVKVKKAKLSLIELLLEVAFAPSKSEARRVIAQGGVKVNGAVVKDPDAVIAMSKDGVVLQKGKRHFVRILPAHK